MRLVYSVETIADLIRLRAFIAAHDPNAAARIADELVTRLALVCRFPAMGKSVQLAPDPEIVRDAILGKYVVRYTIHPSSIVVLRIWHELEDRKSGI